MGCGASLPRDFVLFRAQNQVHSMIEKRVATNRGIGVTKDHIARSSQMRWV